MSAKLVIESVYHEKAVDFSTAKESVTSDHRRVHVLLFEEVFERVGVLPAQPVLVPFVELVPPDGEVVELAVRGAGECPVLLPWEHNLRPHDKGSH